MQWINCPWCGHTYVYRDYRVMTNDLGEHICKVCNQIFEFYKRTRRPMYISFRFPHHYNDYKTKRVGKLKKGGHKKG